LPTKAEGNLPVLDILSSCHEAAWIQGMLLSFNSSVRRVNNGCLVTPRYIVTDFSYALMHACVQVFNDSMQLDAYLQLTYTILERRCTLAHMKNITFFILCAVHMLKALLKTVPNKDSRALAMTFFAALQHTMDLQAAAWTYRAIALVPWSQRETMARTLQRARKKATTAAGGIPLPPIPSDVRFKKPNAFTDMVLFDSGPTDDQLIMLGCDELLDGLARATLWLADGTFKVVQDVFFQLYSIQLDFGSRIHPAAIYCLLTNKTSNTYSQMLDEVLSHIPQAKMRNVF